MVPNSPSPDLQSITVYTRGLTPPRVSGPSWSQSVTRMTETDCVAARAFILSHRNHQVSLNSHKPYSAKWNKFVAFRHTISSPADQSPLQVFDFLLSLGDQSIGDSSLKVYLQPFPPIILLWMGILFFPILSLKVFSVASSISIQTLGHLFQHGICRWFSAT